MEKIRYFIFSLLILVSIFSFACTKNLTNTETFIISGVVTLEGETDYSDITVALYAPAELDTAIVNMHKRFPTVGFELTQAAVFDHREAAPVYTTKTDKEGKYTLANLPGGEYNLVASKEGFGWRYLYNINSETQPADIKLLPEIEVQGTLDLYTIWGAYQHVIVKGDIIVPEGAILMVDKGAVVRVDGYYGIEVRGEMRTNGDADYNIWFTRDIIDNNNYSWKGIQLYCYSIQCILNFVKIENAKFAFKCNQANVIFNHCFIYNNEYGIQAYNEAECQVVSNIIQDNEICIDIESDSKGEIICNIILNKAKSKSSTGIQSTSSQVSIKMNCLSLLYYGIFVEFENETLITQNYIRNCEFGVYYYYGGKEETNEFLYNTIVNSGITSMMLVASTVGDCFPKINNNNIIQKNGRWLLIATGKRSNFHDIDAMNNYWGQNLLSDIKLQIKEERTDSQNNIGDWTILVEPFSRDAIASAYPGIE